MQPCLPLAYDIQLPQDTVLVSNGKATASRCMVVVGPTSTLACRLSRLCADFARD
jgi:hypothetical protein